MEHALKLDREPPTHTTPQGGGGRPTPHHKGSGGGADHNIRGWGEVRPAANHISTTLLNVGCGEALMCIELLLQFKTARREPTQPKYLSAEKVLVGPTIQDRSSSARLAWVPEPLVLRP